MEDPTMTRFHCLGLLAVVALCVPVGCDVPVVPTEGTESPATYIAGTLRLVGNEISGPAILLRFDCDNPPPPVGSGAPVDFVVVPETALDSDEAPFIFPSVPPETCSLLTGFVDGDRDFHYDYAVTSQATAGDIAVTTETVVTASSEEGSDYIPPSVGVLLRAETEVPLEPPSFELRDPVLGEVVAPAVELGPTVGTTPQVLVEVAATEIHSSAMDVDQPVLTLVFGPDGDEDGLPDDLDGDGLPDVLWPRVLVRRLDPLDPAGLAVQDPGVLLPGLVVPLDVADPLNPETNLALAAANLGLPFDGATPFLVDRLTVLVPPLVVTELDPLTTAPIEEVAASGVAVVGRYQVLVMNSTGQRWSLPNALADLGLEAQAAAFEVLDEG